MALWRTAGRRFVLTICLLAAAARLGGCAAPPVKAQDYNSLFAKQQYSASYDAAAKVAGSLSGRNKDHASLVAGLSARSLGRNDDAKKWLTPLSNNGDRAIAGQSAAALGSIAQDSGRHQEAVQQFTKAGKLLSGDDAAHALMCAGDSARALHKSSEATDLYTQALAKVVNDSRLRVDIGDRLHSPPPTSKFATAGKAGIPASDSGKYTVQAGAFSTLKRAQSEAKKLSGKGPIRTVPIHDRSGNVLYAVQVGRFQSKQAADQLRRKLGTSAIVTTMADQL